MGDDFWACVACGYQYNGANSAICVACDQKREAASAPPVVVPPPTPQVAAAAALEPARQADVERALAQAGRGEEPPEENIDGLVSVLLNIVREPDNMRYRRLNLTNKRVAKLTTAPGVAGILAAAGFQRTQQAPAPGTDEAVPYLELAPVLPTDVPRCLAVARLLEDWLTLRRQMQASITTRSAGGPAGASANTAPVSGPASARVASASSPLVLDVDLVKTSTGVGVSVSEDAIVTKINATHASMAGVQPGARIIAVNGVYVDSRSSVQDVLRVVKMGEAVAFKMEMPSAARDQQAAFVATDGDDAASLALARQLQQEEDALQQDRAALLAERRLEADRQAARSLADQQEASLALARQLQAEDEEARRHGHGGSSPPIAGTVLPPSGYPLPRDQIPRARAGRSGGSGSAMRTSLSRAQSAASAEVFREDELEAKDKLAAINAACTAEDPFVDPSFPPIARSVGAVQGDRDDQRGLSAAGLEHCEWRRPQSLAPHDGWGRVVRRSQQGQWSVFNGDPLPSDVKQGRLGNCWFLSALAVLAEPPHGLSRLQNILVESEYNSAGAYAVRLCIDGLWTTTIVDDTFPAFIKPGYVPQLMFSKSERQQLWVPLIEKAFAKLMGSYANIESGRLVEALGVLTGAPCEELALHEGERDVDRVEGQQLDTELLWGKVISYHSAGFLMGASCSSGRPGEDSRSQQERAAGAEAMGLITDHAYSLLAVLTVGSVRLVKLRNPWGRGEWRGDYAPGRDNWTAELRAAAARIHTVEAGENPEGGKGEFWMSWNDFLTHYHSLTVCKLRSDWMERRIALPTELGQRGMLGSCTITALKLNTFAPTWAELTIQQKSGRSQNYDAVTRGDLGLICLKVPAADFDLTRYDRWSLVGDSLRTTDETFSSCEVHLEHGYGTHLDSLP